MSQATTPEDRDEAFREKVREVFKPHLKSRQALDIEGVNPHPQEPKNSRHFDGSAIYQHFGMAPFADQLRTAAKNDHPIAQYPEALAHLVSHVESWEKHLLSSGGDLEELPRTRRMLFEWLREKPEKRLSELISGGTDLLAHGGQGSTKTTMLLWLAIVVLQTNPLENIIWQASLDDSEWKTLGPWATACLPADVDVKVSANPYRSKYGRQAETVTLAIDDIARDVLTYENPHDLARQLANRRAGQIYVVFPDPRFRKCRAITNRQYTSIWEAERTTEATDLKHFWFALLEAIFHSTEYNDWTTIIDDEAQKWLHQRASQDEHEWWDKIQDWALTYGDARKNRTSAFLACHNWHKVHSDVRDKMRWGATMRKEEFPPSAPIDGTNSSQSLGQAVVWKPSSAFNHVGWSDLKSELFVAADIDVKYPGWEEVRNAKA